MDCEKMLYHKLKCLKSGDIIDDHYTLYYTDGALLTSQFSRPLVLKNLPGVGNMLIGCQLAPLPNMLLEL